MATSNRRWLLISLVIFCENDGWKLRLRRGFSSRVNHNSETTKCIASKSWCTMIGGDTNINEKSAYCSRFIADPSSGYREVGGFTSNMGRVRAVYRNDTKIVSGRPDAECGRYNAYGPSEFRRILRQRQLWSILSLFLMDDSWMTVIEKRNPLYKWSISRERPCMEIMWGSMRGHSPAPLHLILPVVG